MDKSDNPLKKFLERHAEAPHAFAIRSRIREGTVYRIYNGGRPQRATAVRICRFTNKELTLQDFGY